MSLFIVLPTYNERENLETLFPRIFSVLPSAQVLVVDDNSPDGTGDFVETYKEGRGAGGINLLRRPRKEGLGKAYLAGFARALELGATKIVEMDADHSHDPQALPGMLELSERADLVIGSRYVAGGGTEGWPWHRKALSRSANIYAKTILRLPIKDVTTGYRCFNRNVLERIDLKKVQSTGYGFQVEMAFKAYREGFSIAEYPILFRDRKLGRSKMGMHVALEGAITVWKLRNYKPAVADPIRPILYSSGE